MSETDPVAMVAAAVMDIRPAAFGTMLHAGGRYEQFSADLVTRTVHLTLAGWVAAVNGDDATLAAIAQPDAARWLRQLARRPPLIAPGPRVTAIEVWALDADADPATLQVKFDFAGRLLSADPGRDEGETMFAGILDLTLAGTGPWQPSSCRIQTTSRELHSLVLV